FICNMDLFLFPFDIQKCKMEFELGYLTEEDVMWDRNMVKVSQEKLKGGLFDSPQLKISEIKGTRVELVLSLPRKFGAFVFNIFLPCLVMVLLGLLTHAFPVDAFTDRVTINLSCLIVMAALFT
ncbi:unnamed protein product, partial [Meganyctiphanes norvegica]